MLLLRVILFCFLCAFCVIRQGNATCAFFHGGDGLGSTLMSFLLIQGLRSGGGFQGTGIGGHHPTDEDANKQGPTQAVGQPIVAKNPLLLPLLLAGSFGGFGGGRLGGLGALGIPLLLGMGGGLGGMAGLAPIALLGLSGMGGGGMSALAPLALLGMGRFRPFGARRIVYTNSRAIYKDMRTVTAIKARDILNGTATVLENGTIVWSPIASANRLRRHFGYGFLWGRKRAKLLKKVADDIQTHPTILGDVAGKVWGHHSFEVLDQNGTETNQAMHRSAMAGGKFIRWINKVPKTKNAGKGIS